MKDLPQTVVGKMKGVDTYNGPGTVWRTALNECQITLLFYWALKGWHCPMQAL